jgi:hydroxypyruvate isomerase
MRHMSTAFTLAACAEMLWLEKPMAWRLKRLTGMGLQCGIWNWASHDIGMLEAFASGSAEDALAAFQAAFTL